MFRKYKHPRGNSGQSTVEYIVLVTAVIGVIILFMNGPNSVFQKKVNETVDTATEGMTAKADSLTTSHNTVGAFNKAPKVNINPVSAKPF